jgi:signal transduction histidine kinase
MTLSFRDRPIVWKLMAVALATVLIALVVSTSVSLWTTYSTLRSGLENDLEGQAGIIAENTSSTLAFDDPVLANETLRTLRLMPSVDLGCLYAADGKLFASFPQPPIRDRCDEKPPPIGKSVVNGKLHVTVAGGAEGAPARRLRAARQPEPGTRPVPGAGVRGLCRHGPRGRRRGAAVAAAAATDRAARSSSCRRPRTRLPAPGDYTLRAKKANDDEIGRLVVAFNAMVAEVERRGRTIAWRQSVEGRIPGDALARIANAVERGVRVDPDSAGRRNLAGDGRARLREHRPQRPAQATLIEDLLDISRIVTGKLRLRSEPVDLKTIAENALEVAKPSAEAKQIALNRQLPDGPAEIVGDPDRLQQIAWNLLSNAVKFTPAGGAVDVSLVGAERDWKLIVRDTGGGIDPAFLPHVFDRFRQADGSITRRYGGLGLGLAIVHELTELHGGRIDGRQCRPQPRRDVHRDVPADGREYARSRRR